ncbi:site-specific integrase [Halobacillus andaensis]|uniref:Site-specific integrase n=1 Tax=Halobacillus andaensis TaxID=1176239 RepID=A0A917EX15_HALAA|nr:site-specific integrase [Halobacillus andaensis]MBP2006014.1 integrase [Halobacillus andaensis]GGF24287.1 site-specific integrase [Halobacillus andaensis]
MAGSIEKRGNNSWRLIYSMGYDQAGKRVKKTRTVKAKNKTEAKKLLAEFVTEIEAGAYIDPSKMKFESFVSEWKEKYAKKHLAPKTIETYSYPLRNYLIPTFGQLKLDEIKPIRIINYLDSLGHDGVRKDGKEGGLASTSILYHYRILEDIFNRAAEWKLIKESPVKTVKRPKIESKKTEVYTQDEVQQLFSMLENQPIHQSLIIKLAITTGLRRGELLGLQWEDIDFDKRTIEVNHTLQHIKEEGFQLRKPKTKSSLRTVVAPIHLIEELKEYKHVKNKERLQVAEHWEGGNHSFVFSTWNGKPLYPTVPGTWWRRFIKRTGFKHIRFHDLRHTAATLLINQGVHAKVISERLGHADIKTTMNIYGHYVRQADEEAADKLNSLFQPSPNSIH